MFIPGITKGYSIAEAAYVKDSYTYDATKDENYSLGWVLNSPFCHTATYFTPMKFRVLMFSDIKTIRKES